MPARSYAFNFNATNSVSLTKTLGAIHNGAAGKFKIYDIQSGSDAVADNAAKYQVIRVSATSNTATQVSQYPVDADDARPGSVAYEYGTTAWGGTVAPVVTGSIPLQWGQNQRATYRWVAAPGKELSSAVATGTFPSGLGVGVLCAVGTATFNSVWSLEFEE